MSGGWIDFVVWSQIKEALKKISEDDGDDEETVSKEKE